ncbi:unnamed protein product [Absidia cylindrospora]
MTHALTLDTDGVYGFLRSIILMQAVSDNKKIQTDHASEKNGVREQGWTKSKHHVKDTSWTLIIASSSSVHTSNVLLESHNDNESSRQARKAKHDHYHADMELLKAETKEK